MNKRLVAIDPGYATGISVWRVPDDEPIERIEYMLIPGGTDGFIGWWNNAYGDILIAEEFIQDGRTPRVDPNAFEIQGLLKGTWDMWFEEIHWQRNAAKSSIPDKLLKQHGFWLTGKQVGWKDGNDVNDSQRHALHWAMNNHAPSQEFYWKRSVK